MAAPVQMTEFSPLQIPEVLKTIFEGSTVAELKEYRKVCQSWNVESSKVLRKSAQLEIGIFGRDSSLGEFMTLVDNELCVFKRKDSFPETVLIDDYVGTKYDARFWGEFGCHIKNLELRDFTFPHINDFREAIFHSCPNLEKLEMSRISLDGPSSSFPDDYFLTEEDAKADGDSNDYPQRGYQYQAVNKNLKFLKLQSFKEDNFPVSFFKRLINHSPNLETLHMGLCSWKSTNAIFSALKDGDGRAGKLKKVRLHFLDFENPNEMVEILTSGKLRLEHLELDVFSTREDVSTAQRILESYTATLKKFKLQLSVIDDDESQPKFALSDGVVLGNLEELTLEGVRKLKSTNFWKCVPNLKKLVVKDTFLTRFVRPDNIQELRNVALINCVEVELIWCYVGAVKSKVIRKLAALLPNVRKLKLEDACWAGSSRIIDVFTIICGAFPKLVELRVVSEGSGRSLDSAVTGLDGELVEKINQEGKKGDWKQKSVPRAGLAKLKELKVLSIRCHEGLGYSSAVSGIRRLPQLEQLQLGFKEVDEEAWNGNWKPLLARFPWRGN